jgi:hypothetical protein
MRRASRLVILLAVLCGGCGPTIDLSKGLQVLDVSTGWYDAGIVDGKNKLVPSNSFKLKNLSDRKLGTLQGNAVFRRLAANDDWGGNGEFISVTGSEGLAPGQITPTLTVRSRLGYTGTDPRQDMLHNKQFVDAKIELFAKYEATQWARLGEYPIARQLIPRE